MADIPQEVREAAWPIIKHLFVQTRESESHWRDATMRGNWDDHYICKTLHAMLLAGKRAGMERAAEIADQSAIAQRALGRPKDWPVSGWDDRQLGIINALEILAQAIRSEANGHG